LREALSGPWQRKHASAKIGRTSRLNWIGAEAAAGAGASSARTGVLTASESARQVYNNPAVSEPSRMEKPQV
jgi:hypothetical protein